MATMMEDHGTDDDGDVPGLISKVKLLMSISPVGDTMGTFWNLIVFSSTTCPL